MSSSNVASADDFEEQVESTAVPGQLSTKQFPPAERPNACRSPAFIVVVRRV